MLIKIPIYFDITGNPSTEILREFIRDLQSSVTTYLSDDDDLVDALNYARESESFPEVFQVVDYVDMMARILKPNSAVLVEPKKVPVKRKPRTAKKK